MVKTLPATQEIQVQSLGREDSLPVGRREWLPTPVFLPGEFHGLYSPWGRKESEVTERLSLHLHFHCILNHPLHIPLLKKLQPKQFVFDMVILQGKKRKAS